MGKDSKGDGARSYYDGEIGFSVMQQGQPGMRLPHKVV